MFRRIVVAFDGSDHAQDALALALRLRDPDGGRLTLACATSAASEMPRTSPSCWPPDARGPRRHPRRIARAQGRVTGSRAH